ncbi:MAG: STT3 domain-containing protein [Candidatus Diapherotrites archaeon]
MDTNIQGGLEFLGKVDWKKWAIVLLIFLLAFAVRGHLIKYDLMFGFDSYFHARIAGYVVENYEIPDRDPLAYYQMGGSLLPKESSFFWIFTAAIYKVFTFGGAYDKDLWIIFVKFLPAVFGALIAAAMFFLGKEMYNTKTGVAMGFFAALVPSFVYRTMAGFFEEDSLGFLWMVIGFIFFVRALKSETVNRAALINAVLAGLFFGIMAFTWEMFLLVPMIMAAYLVTSLGIMWFRNFNFDRIRSFVMLFGVAFIIFALMATAFQWEQCSEGSPACWYQKAVNYVGSYAPISAENIARGQTKGPTVLAQTVGEENTGFQFWGEKYNALVIFPLLALFLIPYKLLRDRKEHFGLIIFFWVVITGFMAISKLKFTYTFGLPIAASAGFVFNELFILMKGRTDFEKKAVGLAMGFMLLVAVGAGVYFVSNKTPNIEFPTGWKESLYWVEENTPEGSKFFNWWDEGHWITFVGERGVIEDNRNNDYAADQNTARFILSKSEEEAYKIVDGYKSDYVLLSADLLTKTGSLNLYAFDTTDGSDPRIQANLDSAGSPTIYFDCGRSLNQLTSEITYICGPNSFPEKDFIAWPTQWQSQYNVQFDARNVGFVYRATDNSRLYIVGPKVNSMMISKLFFNDPSIRHFEEAYSKGDVKIWKVVA